MSDRRTLNGMNFLLFMTDQERALQHFPSGWAEKNLPGQQRLLKYELNFTRAFCCSAMCSPSRASMMTGYFPAQHGVKWCLESSMNSNPQKWPQRILPRDFPNLATVMSASGYSTPYKGKFHLTKPPLTDPTNWTACDLDQYGFQRWNYPDAGENQAPDQFGGGKANNDGRFMEADAEVVNGKEGALAYLRSSASKEGPFAMVISLVNPHDVLAYPNNTGGEYGYTAPEWFEGDIGVPVTMTENLRPTKPLAQQQILDLMNAGSGPARYGREAARLPELLRQSDAPRG